VPLDLAADAGLPANDAPLDLAADADAGLPANDVPLDLAVDAWWCTWSCARLRPANDAALAAVRGCTAAA
jgi:hypothetical protein